MTRLKLVQPPTMPCRHEHATIVKVVVQATPGPLGPTSVLSPTHSHPAPLTATTHVPRCTNCGVFRGPIAVPLTDPRITHAMRMIVTQPAAKPEPAPEPVATAREPFWHTYRRRRRR